MPGSHGQVITGASVAASVAPPVFVADRPVTVYLSNHDGSNPAYAFLGTGFTAPVNPTASTGYRIPPGGNQQALSLGHGDSLWIATPNSAAVTVSFWVAKGGP